MRSIAYLVVHTCGAYDAEHRRVVHQPIAVVKRIHMLPKARFDAAGKLIPGTGGRGFTDIGYNRYIEVDGKIRLGRIDATAGAHCENLNHRSLGVCCSGDGDHEPFNPAQLNSLVAQLVAWCRLYHLGPERVIGHRESPKFGAAPTSKTCPGRLVDMDVIRARVRDELAGVHRGEPGAPGENDPQA